jgi:DNA primase
MNNFNKSLLPNPSTFYRGELSGLKISKENGIAKCPFHKDGAEKHPSLAINLTLGYFKCFACGAKGGDILAFQMMRYSQSFKEAAITLGAWEAAC